jgi:ATP-dependent Clp protease ATP-binding subunit ClpA
MSEYAEPHTVSKLVGSPPGYVGSTDPEGWLSTRIRGNPNVVLLLDEIEKAHPQVWNTFLQVFDAGRLTDSTGVTALFHNTVVVLTSNIGAGSFVAGPSLGFGDRPASATAESHGVLRAVKQQMPPELVNRLDEVLVFSPLSREAVHDIAKAQLVALTERMRPRGYELEIDDQLVDLVVEEGFSREYGARPLQRAIERLLVSPLASLPRGSYHGVAHAGSPAWVPSS